MVATAAAELAGTSTSAGYGAPYNHASDGQKLGPLPLQSWGGVRIPVDSANDLVISPLQTSPAMPFSPARCASGRRQRRSTDRSGPARTPTRWLRHPTATRPRSSPATTAQFPRWRPGFLDLANSGSLEGLLTTRTTFYGGDATKPLLLLADGAYLEDQARADHLGGDQWGMMNETGNYPGQPWMWLYTFWYQVKPFSTSDNADALVWGLMAVLTLGLILLPFIPGLRSLPRHLGVHRLIWRDPVAPTADRR